MLTRLLSTPFNHALLLIAGAIILRESVSIFFALL